MFKTSFLRLFNQMRSRIFDFFEKKNIIKKIIFYNFCLFPQCTMISYRLSLDIHLEIKWNVKGIDIFERIFLENVAPNCNFVNLLASIRITN